MAEPVALSIATSGGRPLVHKYFPAQGEPQGLALLLPGDHYGVDGPLLYYPNQALQKRGWDTLALTYGYQSAGRQISLNEIPLAVDEIARGLKAALAYRPAPRLLLIGKSLGAALIPSLYQIDAAFELARAVYLTPPLGMPFFASAFKDTIREALVILGTADRFYDEQTLSEMRSGRTFELMRIEGGDHSLNIGGDLKATLQVLGEVVRKVLEFASR